MFKRPSVLYVTLAIGALLLGLLVYLFDRQPDHVYFLSHGFALAHPAHSGFGVLGGSLPTFVHVYAFILLTAAIAGSTIARLSVICAAWFVIASLFEFAQLPALSPVIAAAVPAWFARVPVLDNTAAYFLDGTFDWMDILSIVLGTLAAYLTIAVLRKTVVKAVQESGHRILRHIALAGVTALGMLTIIASGGGGGTTTPDTTAPTVVSTNPADAATGFFIGNLISVTFSEAMDSASVNNATFTLNDDTTSTPVFGAITHSGNTYTFTPNSGSLTRNNSYTATVTTGVKDVAGNALAADKILNFTTEQDAWQAQAISVTNAPTARYDHTAVWTGSQMIVWGGTDGVNYFNGGGAYNLSNNTWSTISSVPTGFAGRSNHTAVWTGTEMIIWGGNIGGMATNTGAAYNPSASTNKWRLISTTGAPAARFNHTAVWTGSQMIVWGGFDGINYFADGAAYDPVADAWSTIPAPPLSFAGRYRHSAVWTGSEMIVWGGNTNAGLINTGAAYNPSTKQWRLISTTGAPTARFDHTAVWTGPSGTSMVVWGGQDSFGNYLNDGSRYDPVTDTWSAVTSVPFSFAGRSNHTAAWTGSQMIIWGGATPGSVVTNSGGVFTP